MNPPKRLIYKIHHGAFLPMRECAECLLWHDIPETERQLDQIIRILDDLRLAWEILTGETLTQEPAIVDLIDFLFLNYYLSKIERLAQLINDLYPKLFQMPRYRKLRKLSQRCQQKARNLLRQGSYESYLKERAK